MPASAIASKLDLAEWQGHLDFLLPNKELLRADEVAKALDCDERTILRLFDDARLIGHDINAATGQRQQVRYRRAGVILFLADRSNYTPASLRERLLEILFKLSLRELVLMQQAIGELIRRKQS
jgi:hypothetical protein